MKNGKLVINCQIIYIKQKTTTKQNKKSKKVMEVKLNN